MIIHSYENSARADSCIDYIRRSDITEYIEQLILLPIPTTRDKTTILGTKIYISEVLELLDERSLVVGYGLPDEFKRSVLSKGQLVHDVFCDEEFLVKNAYLTAEAIVGVILTTEKRALSDMTVGVVGYGRIGKHLCRLLLYMGARIKVYTSTRSTLLDLSEIGIDTSFSDADADLSGLDILINTAPSMIFGADGGLIPPELRVIDLASGDNFPSTVPVEKYPSIPAKMFPHTSGVLWGSSIEKYIKGITSRKGG